MADQVDELTHDAPGRPAFTLDEAIARMEADRGLDQEVVRALRETLGKPSSSQRDSWPAGLTDREVDVLRLAARGLTRKQIGDELQISESTVRHHLEHIYQKTGSTSRVAATLFAVENGILT